MKRENAIELIEIELDAVALCRKMGWEVIE